MTNPTPPQKQENNQNIPTTPLNVWLRILDHKLAKLHDSNKYDLPVLRHLFADTIEHLQLGWALVRENREAQTMTRPSLADSELANLLKDLDETSHPFRRPAPSSLTIDGAPQISDPPETTLRDHPPEEGLPHHAISSDNYTPPLVPKILWWQNADVRYETFVELAKEIISKAYDKSHDQPRWLNREKSPLSKYFQAALRLGKLKKVKVDPIMDSGLQLQATLVFASALQRAMKVPTSRLSTSTNSNLSFLLADLEKLLGLLP